VSEEFARTTFTLFLKLMSIDYRLQASVQIQVMEQHYEIKKKAPFLSSN